MSIQAQVVNLLKDLQEELGVTYLFTAHDLSMVRYISHRIAVMYLGSIVETGETDQVFRHALHPYTKALLSAVPEPVVGKKKEAILEGEPEKALDAAETACLFASRCPYKTAACMASRPKLEDIGDGHCVSCLRWREIND